MLERKIPIAAACSVALVVLLLVLFAPPAADAQHDAKVSRIGILWAHSPSEVAPFVEAFRQGLRGLGYVEGRNIALEELWAEGRFDRLPSLAAELARLKVDILVVATTPAARAAQQATKTIPIVLTLVTDPVEGGFVGSLARPGGNITGLSLMHPELSGKRLALLKELVPKASRMAVLWSVSTPSHPRLLRETEAAARGLGVQLQLVEVRGPAELDDAFSVLLRGRAEALVVLPDPMFRNQLRRIVDLATKSRLPALYWSRDLVEADGLMAYGANVPDGFRQAATFVDKILKGARPADLPIEQPSKFELIINTRTARALGLTIPPALLLGADQVIE